ncbi:Outer membrane protein A [Roseobacter fucihabitans]|uniref:Outer membrane protein A n=1 Tax=Roseobacter fucihabitans TaxID=1537242 RepID=A0ABZ2C1Q0_9RHOB|nr:OmpA family protein [Roseobacter litoralis]MBC6963765.1 Outer membrane porin F precursor [Roseobacter litoralis]
MSLRLVSYAVMAACGMASAALADLVLPDVARLTAQRDSARDSFAAPIAVFSDGGVPSQTVEGFIERAAWRIDTSGLTSLQVMAPLRAQLETLGFDVAFECVSKACGGFDFRFAIEVLPGPNMYVNIARYRYLTAFKGPPEQPDETVSVLVSVTAAAAYVQIITAVSDSAIGDVQTPPDEGAEVEGLASTAASVQTGDLMARGFVILSDLDFALGSTDLGPGPFASLERLAKIMSDDAELRVALVGHTDMVGDLDVNINVSRARARSVRARLIEDYGIEPARLDAEGMGYLAPVATNATAQGRSQNRRVEAISLNVE